MRSFILFLFAATLCLPLSADWKVTKTKGKSFTEVSGVKTPLEVGAVLKPGTKVITSSSARVKLTSSSSSVWLGQKTIFVIPQTEEKEEKSYLMQLLKGKLRAKVEPGSVNKFEVKTPIAVAGVRGTEFFVDTDSDTSFVCTIKGAVEVKKAEESKKIDVPMCSGVELNKGQSVNLLPTPSRQVAKWVSQTSVEDNQPIVVDEYKLLTGNFKSLKGPWHYRTNLFTNIAVLDGTNYGGVSGEKSNQVFYGRFAPALRYQGKWSFQIEPRLLLGEAGSKFNFSRNSSSEKSVSELRLGESFIETEAFGGNLRLGLQSLKWNDGNLLSRDFWSLETYLYPGLRYRKPINDDLYLDTIFIGKGTEDKLSGQVPVEMIGLKLDFRAWTSFYILDRNYKASDSLKTTAIYKDHKVTDVGISSGHHLTRWDYDVFYNHQFGDRISGATKKSHSEASMGFQYGYYPYPHRDFRIGLGFHKASSNYLPGFESPFLLGYSQLLTRTNLQQFRFKLGFGLNENWTMNLEQIKNISLRSGDFSNWSGSEGQLFDELDLGFVYNNPEKQFSALIAMFFVSPRATWTDAFPSSTWDSGTGMLINIQKSF